MGKWPARGVAHAQRAGRLADGLPLEEIVRAEPSMGDLHRRVPRMRVPFIQHFSDRWTVECRA
jgi:hypothetical protein